MKKVHIHQAMCHKPQNGLNIYEAGVTLCGQKPGGTYLVTADPSKITCELCKKKLLKNGKK